MNIIFNLIIFNHKYMFIFNIKFIIKFIIYIYTILNMTFYLNYNYDTLFKIICVI